MGVIKNGFALYASLVLGGASACWAQGTSDSGTQRNGMHSCPEGQFVMGAEVAKNLLLCESLPGNFAAEIVDSGTQDQGMHACPPGMTMTGLQASKNLLACAPLTNPPPSRFVDSSTQELGMHACPGGAPAAGIHVNRNLLLCAGAQTGEFEDADTQRNGMHSCPLGSFMSGAQIARNLLLCTTASLESSSEIVDNGTQSHGMHACPEGSVMTGIHASTNQLACTHLNAALIPRLVDRDTQRQGMHACPPGQPMSGIQVDKNLNLCGDEYVVRVNDFAASPSTIQSGGFVSLSWNVTCTDPACIVTLSGGKIGGVLPPAQYVGIGGDRPTSNATYEITAAAGGGSDARSQTVQVEGKAAPLVTTSLVPSGGLTFLQITGSGFQADETVRLNITYQIGDNNPSTFTEQTPANSFGDISYQFSGTGGGLCDNTTTIYKFTVQGTGLQSGLISNIVQTGCL
jgi:hypothetical protein